MWKNVGSTIKFASDKNRLSILLNTPSSYYESINMFIERVENSPEKLISFKGENKWNFTDNNQFNLEFIDDHFFVRSNGIKHAIGKLPIIENYKNELSFNSVVNDFIKDKNIRFKITRINKYFSSVGNVSFEVFITMKEVAQEKIAETVKVVAETNDAEKCGPAYLNLIIDEPEKFVNKIRAIVLARHIIDNLSMKEEIHAEDSREPE